MNRKDWYIVFRTILSAAYVVAFFLLLYIAFADNVWANFVNRYSWPGYVMLVTIATIVLTVLNEIVDAFGEWANKSEEPSGPSRLWSGWNTWFQEAMERLHSRVENPDPMTSLMAVVFGCIPVGLSLACFVLRNEEAREAAAYLGWTFSILLILVSSCTMAVLPFALDLGKDVSDADE